MAEEQKIVDSPIGWVAKHIKTYVDSGGKRGTTHLGRESLLLTTKGRRTGKFRRTALFYGRHGDAYVVVGSNGASVDHPLWYYNLLAEPRVTVQVGEETFEATARPATPAERPALWRQMAEIFPTYDSYAKRVRREIPVVVLERLAS
jgi:deazaflavin-dependent oxidoreductase (nitroreductase family)